MCINLFEIGLGILHAHHEQTHLLSGSDFANDHEMAATGRQGLDLAGHNLLLSNFDLTRVPKAVFPNRMLLEIDAVGARDALDIGCQLVELALLIAGENRRMLCLYLSAPYDTRSCFRRLIALPIRRESRSNKRRDDQCGETQARRR